MPRKGGRHSDHARAKISASLTRTAAHRQERDREREERKAEAARVYPRDLAHLEATGTVTAPLQPLFEIAEAENLELMDALGGDEITPQRKVLLQDCVRVGLVLRGELARYLQSGDSDSGARVGSLANARRQSLLALGLDRTAKPVLTPAQLGLVEVVARPVVEPEASEGAPGRTNSPGSDSIPQPADAVGIEKGTPND